MVEVLSGLCCSLRFKNQYNSRVSSVISKPGYRITLTLISFVFVHNWTQERGTNTSALRRIIFKDDRIHRLVNLELAVT